jgi:fibro-slime domain-containing protein
VADTLGEDGKPVFIGDAYDGFIKSASSFAEWYHSPAGNAGVVPGVFTLFNSGEGAYSIRWKSNGEPYPKYTDPVLCGNAGDSCTALCDPSDYDVCQDPCDYWDNSLDTCGVRVEYLDGTPLFFPVDGHPNALTPASPLSEAVIAPPFAEYWPVEDPPVEHNFSFTSELRFWSRFDTGESVTVTIEGDDDFWLFVNNELAMDGGGIHTPIERTFTINGTIDEKFKIEENSIYEAAIFHAERQTTASTMKITISGYVPDKTTCTPL